MKTKTDRYLIFVWGDLEPEIVGPFLGDGDRNACAKRLREEEGNEHGMYPLDVAGGILLVGAYSGAFFG